jgi:1-acyl-sn-glycerol-3-phosphate acyltransferase
MNVLADIIAGTARLISGAHARWTDSLPDSTQKVYFANHTSHLDFVVLWACLPQPVRRMTRPVAARDYWDSGLRRKLAVDVFQAILVQRNPGKNEGNFENARITIDRIVEEMGERYSLIIFPEGTRGTGDAVGAFKSGLYHLCHRKPDLPLVPVYINNLNRILPKGEFLPVPFISQITFGAMMRLNSGEAKNDFLARARQALCRLKPS